jgi:hypothetical protein
LELVDRDGSVLKTFTKGTDGSLSESTVDITPPVARVVTGTIDTALSGTPVAMRFGELRFSTVASGEGIPDDDDGTELIPYLAANAALIPADSVVDNEDLTFTITFHPGANGIPLVSGDAALTFVQDTAGADAVNQSLAVSGFNAGAVDAGSGNSAFLTITELAHPEASVRITKVEVAALPITIANTTGISFGAEPLLTFPAGKIHILSSNVEDFLWGLENAGNATPITGLMGGDISLGSTATSDATLNSTDVNILASTSYDPFSAAIAANSAINVILDGTTTPVSVYLNAIIDDADVANAASDVLEANGSFYFVWYRLPG